MVGLASVPDEGVLDFVTVPSCHILFALASRNVAEGPEPSGIHLNRKT